MAHSVCMAITYPFLIACIKAKSKYKCQFCNLLSDLTAAMKKISIRITITPLQLLKKKG